jgi:pimeloyl-ACP methyl ester carboxylesterase
MLVDGPDCRLWVEVAGEGAPVSVWTHGVTSSIAPLRRLSARAAGTRVLLDLRGHGQSEAPPPEAGYDHAAMRRDLEHVAARFGATRAFGVSMGAGAILSMLASDPDRFERAALLIPASLDGPNLAAQGIFPGEADEIERTALPDLAARAETAPVYAELFARRPHLRALVRERIAGINPAGAPRALRGYVDGPPPVADAESLRRVRAPVLILAHEGDPIHDAAVARRLAELLPNSTLRMWPETLAMFDDEDALAGDIAAFLTC